MTVAREPLLDGERNPSRANTVRLPLGFSGRRQRVERTEGDAHHGTHLSAIASHDRQEHRESRRPEDFSVDEFPSPVFLNVFLL
jgi:hypothetical protein